MVPAAVVDALEREVATYRNAFETTAADRDRLARELAQANARLEELQRAHETLRTETAARIEVARAGLAPIEALQKEVGTLQHAFETTAAARDHAEQLAADIAAERDQHIADKESFKVAFETTAEDRDGFQRRYEIERSALEGLLSDAPGHLQMMAKPIASIPQSRRASGVITTVISEINR